MIVGAGLAGLTVALHLAAERRVARPDHIFLAGMFHDIGKARVALADDDTDATVRHPGRAAHTTEDAYVWIPERGLLYTGDLVFNRGTPFVLMGSVTGLITTLREQPLLALGLLCTAWAYVLFYRLIAEAGQYEIVRTGSRPVTDDEAGVRS